MLAQLIIENIGPNIFCNKQINLHNLVTPKKVFVNPVNSDDNFSKE